VARCAIQLSRVVVLGGGKVRHAMPEIHIQRLTQADLAEDIQEQSFLANSFGRGWKDDPKYAAFRMDFGKRVLGGFTATQAADYLQANADAWPEHDFSSEIRYFRAKARGDRICQDCGESLPPTPKCDCGCQSPPKPVAGWGLMASTVKPSPVTGNGPPRDFPPALGPVPVAGPENASQGQIALAAPETAPGQELSATPEPTADIVPGGEATREEPDDDANPF